MSEQHTEQVQSEDERLSSERLSAVKAAIGNSAGNLVRTDPFIGYELEGRYQITEFIGAGGWGNVYKATHLTLGTENAVKIIHKHLIQNDASLKRLNQEARLLSRLESPFIVRLRDYGLTPAPYIVMEYFDGEPLNRWLKLNGFLKSDLAIELFLQICQGLTNAHALGLVHRDLKPGNIMLKIEGAKIRCKILDFGIAKLVDEHERLTATGEILGSPPYMSPEQWQGRTDHRSDLYSLGCIMYEVLCAKPAFTAEYGIDYLSKHSSSSPLSIRVSEPLAAVPAALEDLVLKCLAKSPEQRYQSAAEIQADLERLKAGRKLQVHMEKERLVRRNKILSGCGLAFLLIAAILCWQKEPILTAYCNYLNSLADKQMTLAEPKMAAGNYRKTLVVSRILPLQNKARLHAMRRLVACLLQLKQSKEAAELSKQIDTAIGLGSWPEFTTALRRMKYRMLMSSDTKSAMELGRQSLSLATALAGRHSMAYSNALDEVSRIMRAQASFEQALQAEDESLRIAEDLLEADDIVIAERLNNEGETLLAAGQPEAAEKAYLHAMAICNTNFNSIKPAFLPIQNRETLLIANFDNSARTNNLGGEFGTWEKDPNDKTQGTRISFASNDACGFSTGKSLQIDYDVDSPAQAYNGFWMKLAAEDFSSYNTLNFYLKGDTTSGFTKRLKIELKDMSSKPSPYYVFGINDKWQKFSIPFDKFKMVLDWTHMNEFVVVFEDRESRPKIGKLYLDQVFVSEENPYGDEGSVPAQTAAAYNGLGSFQLQKHDLQKALLFFEKAYDLCQKYSQLDALPVFMNMAHAYQQKGDSLEAIEFFKKALDSRTADGSSLCPDTEYICSNLADIYYQLKDFSQAEAYFEQSLKLRESASKHSARIKYLLANLINTKKALGKADDVAALEKRLSLDNKVID